MASLLFLLLILLLPLFLLLLLSFIVRPRPVKIPIKGRHVFITGGSSGIGLALARRAATEGARVSILARSPEKLEQARSSIRLSTGINVAVFSADVRDFEAVRRALDEAGPVDVLICNHGVFVPQELEKQDVETIKFMIDVNLMGTFHLIKAALPGMKNRAGRGPASIALMSSQGGQVGIYGYTAYSASKFGLRGLGGGIAAGGHCRQYSCLSYIPSRYRNSGFYRRFKITAVELLIAISNLTFVPIFILVSYDVTVNLLPAENKIRPELTSIIAASSAAMKADAVAEKSLNGIKSGSFIVTCNFDGIMLSVATAGLSPQRSYLLAFFEVATAGFMRIVVLFFQWNWYRTIERWHTQNSDDEDCIQPCENLK